MPGRRRRGGRGRHSARTPVISVDAHYRGVHEGEAVRALSGPARSDRTVTARPFSEAGSQLPSSVCTVFFVPSGSSDSPTGSPTSRRSRSGCGRPCPEGLPPPRPSGPPPAHRSAPLGEGEPREHQGRAEDEPDAVQPEAAVRVGNAHAAGSGKVKRVRRPATGGGGAGGAPARGGPRTPSGCAGSSGC